MTLKDFNAQRLIIMHSNKTKNNISSCMQITVRSILRKFSHVSITGGEYLRKTIYLMNIERKYQKNDVN